VKGIWITWEKQIRNIGICEALKWELYEIIYHKPKLQRYLKCIIKTIIIIKREKPKIIVAQNPSILLSILIVALKKIFNYKAVIDAHNSGIRPLEGRSRVLMHIAAYLQRFADLTIVTNEGMCKEVESNKGKAIVLPDRLPVIINHKLVHLEGKFKFAYICTFSDDEPYNELINSAKFLNEDVMIYITGNYKNKVDINQFPNHLRFVGFVSEKDYLSLISSVDFIIDLTTRENCLVCGAYEAVALEKPLILSDTKALRKYFSKGCIYVSPDIESIVNGIKKAIHQRKILYFEIKGLKRELKISWDKSFKIFKNTIDSL